MPWNPIHPIKNGKKRCVSCEKELNLEMFSKQLKCKEGIRPECKNCHNKKSKKYYDKNKEKILVRTREYGKTEYRKKYCRQRAKIKLRQKRDSESNRPRPSICECCSNFPDKKGIVWDHNHTDGKFRGWLCNRVLGMCKDSIEILKNLQKYLRSHG